MILNRRVMGGFFLYNAHTMEKVLCAVKVLLMIAVTAAVRVEAATDDVFVTYSTPGIDRYADRTVVRDGECYALVCTKAGAAFRGFAADGTVVDPAVDDIAVVAPAARSGRCRPVVFALPKAYVTEHRADDWKVCLLDTRTAAGVPAGLVDGTLPRINGFGLVDGEVELDDSGFALSRGKGAARIADVSTVPTDVPRPVITDFRVTDGRVVLSVDDTVPYVTYDLVGAESPSGLESAASPVARGKKDGDAARTITLEADAGGKARFFKVVRAK